MMTSFGTRRRPWLYIATFIGLTLLLILLDSQHAFDPIKGGASDVLASWQARAKAVGDRLGLARGSVQNTEDLQAQIDTLTKQRDQLLVDNSRLADLDREVQQLRKQLDFQQAQPTYDIVAADVVKNDRESPRKEATINKGSDDGLAKGMAVTSPEGLMVGVITDLTAHTALVTFVIDDSIHVSAVVQDSGEQGIAVGAWQESKRLLMREVDKNAQITQGQRIVTGNLTNGVVPNLPIGYVYSVKKDAISDTQEIELIPYANFDKLRTVSIVRGKKGP
jgi:rod shape-determining protein MreC